MTSSTEERRMRTDWIPDWEGKGEKVFESKGQAMATVVSHIPFGYRIRAEKTNNVSSVS